MNGRVIIQIAGQEFPMIVEDDEQYLQRIAHYVDQKITQVIEETHASLLNASVLTCMNIADEYFTALEQAENLRHQLKEYIEDSSRSKNELVELKRELARLKKDGK